MNAILKALQAGYPEEEILGFISKAIPEMGSTIKKATKSGYTIKKILGFLSKNFDTEDLRGKSESEIHAANRRADAERTKYGLTAFATTAALPLAATAARSALSRALPRNLAPILGANPSGPLPPSAGGVQSPLTSNPSSANVMNPSNIASAPTSLSPQSLNQQQNASQVPPLGNASNITQVINPVQPKGISNPKEFLEKSGLKDKVDQLLKAGNPPEAIAAALNVGTKGKKATGDIDPELVSMIEEYSKQTPEVEKKQQQPMDLNLSGMGKGMMEGLYTGVFEALEKGESTFAGMKDSLLEAAKPAYEAGQIKSPEDLKRFAQFWKESEKQKKPIVKNETVASPHGVGDVLEVRNGKALIDIDGKKHQVNEDELIQSPLSEEELASLFDEMISGIEKHTGQEVSKNVEWAGYDPINNELAYKPHGSARLYAYDEISPEDAQELTSLLTKRKSTGENHIGVWEAGTTSPIGAAMHKLIMKLQKERGGKGNEYKNRYETIYDALEPAKKASKAQYAKRKKKTQKPRTD